MMLHKRNIIFLVLIIFYIVGIVGILMPNNRSEIVALTPMNLLLTAGLFIYGLNQFNLKFFTIAFITFLLGYGVEVAGVHTGVLFGEYYYGSPLGWKLFDVPSMIGVNWFLLSFSSVGIAKRLFQSKLAVVTFSAILMVLLDVIIEPIAVELDFWNWGNDATTKNFNVPFQNYVMWLIAALGINSLVVFNIKTLKFSYSAFVFGLQIVFFGILNLAL